MKIEVQIDGGCTELRVVITTAQMTDEVEDVIKKLSEGGTAKEPQMIAGFRGEMIRILQQEDIIRVYSSAGKVYAVTGAGEFTVRLRLYEIEERLNAGSFVRISNSEIVNLRKVKSFDLSFTGTICVTLINGTVTYVSRRYVTKIKKVLGI